MKINDFPRDEFLTDKEKLDVLYRWCYELSLYLKGGTDYGNKTSASGGASQR